MDSNEYGWLINLGLVIDIIGFLLLRAEWKTALFDKTKLYTRAVFRLKERLYDMDVKIQRVGPTVANASAASPFGGTLRSMNENRASLDRALKKVLETEPEQFRESQRRLRFELGSLLIVSGFALQIIGNNL